MSVPFSRAAGYAAVASQRDADFVLHRAVMGREDDDQIGLRIHDRFGDLLASGC
jgi:hypothetical protein